MATPVKTASGKWRVQVFVGTDSDGKKRKKSITADTKKEAMLLASQFAVDKKLDSNPNITVKQALMNYIEHCESMHYSPATMKSYYAYVRHAFTEKLLATRINKISLSDIQKSIDYRSKTASPKTVKSETYFLLPALKMAGVKIERDELAFPKLKHQEMSIPTNEEMSAFISACKSENRDVYLGVMLAALLGMRKGEICALQWSDIDFDKSTVTINKALVGGNEGDVEKPPKTDAGYRTIPCPTELLSILRSERGVGRVINKTPTGLSDAYIRVRDKYGFDYRFHSLRHYFVSICASLSIDQRYTMSLVGHTDSTVTHRVYTHVMEHRKREIAEQLNNHTTAILAIK